MEDAKTERYFVFKNINLPDNYDGGIDLYKRDIWNINLIEQQNANISGVFANRKLYLKESAIINSEELEKFKELVESNKIMFGSWKYIGIDKN